ncbi:putative NAD dependent epimerase/dehydratase family protein [Bradyrhizobium sp. ORS 375]|uniref:NAD-dependent epimerase/dehydratase family protein n=1 Tax=Bradyrhizobium sp. (strain ORS 375) TaxID=566679 RepID=UPI0002406495|nr:NAD-dependent epimerase/dehydratase family protein [Bradyrhizobium sp. ORS 375]CCD95589.1 putative NAD dependent epimerase/dehydratase family protein [Bradyrhizobium sp. ORS 375]
MKVLVTGGSGFIGHHLVSALVARGSDVRVLDIRSPTHMMAEVEYLEGSVLDVGLVKQAVTGVDQVYHLAGLPGMWMPDREDFYRVNCVGTETVLAAARAGKVRRFLHCSTESILFDYPGSTNAATAPTAPPAEAMPGAYTRSKALAEARAMTAAADGFPVVVGTPTMPIGPHDSNLTPPSQMLRHFLDSRVQLYLDFIVNLVDVRDVAAGLILAMERGKVGDRYVFGGESLRLSRILALMATISGRKHVAIAVPGGFAELSAGMLEFISDRLTKRCPSGTAEGVRIARSASDLSIDKARRELGYAPRPIEPTLRETIDFLLGAEQRLDEKQHPFRTAAE